MLNFYERKIFSQRQRDFSNENFLFFPVEDTFFSFSLVILKVEPIHRFEMAWPSKFTKTEIISLV